MFHNQIDLDESEVKFVLKYTLAEALLRERSREKGVYDEEFKEKEISYGLKEETVT